MTREEIHNLLKKGEHGFFEAKRADKGLPESLWETYSAFANTNGGVIILGVSENSRSRILDITGVLQPQKLIQDFWNQINNIQKISCNVLLDKHVTIHNIQNKKIICIEVPRASRQEKPVYVKQNPFTGSFRRNAEGDYACTSAEVKSMLRDQSEISPDASVVPECSISDIQTETLRRFRIRFSNLRPAHIWNNLDDTEFLLKIGAVKRSNNILLPTFAGMLMFAEESIITAVLPDFFLDFREIAPHTSERWIDRLHSQSGDWSGNIFDFYFSAIDKILLSIKHPFILKNTDRIDSNPFQEAIREVLANAIIHADYWGKRGIVIEKTQDSLVISNPGLFRISSKEIEQGGISDPRNTTIFKMFSLIGVGERAGSGLHTVFHIWKQLHFIPPHILEGFEPERIITTLFFASSKDSEETEKSSEETEKSSEEIILEIIHAHASITIREMADILDISTRAVEKHIRKLREKGILHREGSTKKGIWVINNA